MARQELGAPRKRMIETGQGGCREAENSHERAAGIFLASTGW